ncbi:protein PRRC2C isoform X4 [Macrosteles quadrilineatus]|uniref:protein PRRC2C isoform X4 n=1 Tax=Macrosteles quadrilineatus TaxID=74068 RepID=UPI0023E32739|nr:protein PRRC2C isoform X4 [Macrosteles quadrilineatus]
MSTLSGLAAKGEKGKSKFQSLDINNLYRASRGESLETHQHKNTSSRRHGMQSLGKVPSARRPPANLPSLKSEYSGNDPAVSLVPSGGTGWGSKPGETGPAPTPTSAPTSTTATVTSAPATTAPVTVTSPPTTATPTPTTTTSQGHVGDKSWSSITSSGTENSHSYLAHQSPYFQQEFPSLSGDGSQGKSEPQHLPGPSLRPQTEGSWMQGGGRPQGQTGAGAGNQQGTVPVPGPHLPQGLDVGGGRSSLGPSGVAVGPAGPMPPHHYRLMPPFMLRHNHPSGGFNPNFQQHGPPRPRMPYPPDTRFMPPNRGPSNVEAEEISRPIIKEEDLKVMDEIARDTGWAGHDEIDYNQTLSFSDEESAQDDVKAKRSAQADKKDDHRYSGKDMDKDEKLNRENMRDPMSDNREPPRAWQQQRPGDFRQGMPPAMMGFPPQPPPARPVPHTQGGRQGEDEEVWHERRRMKNEEIAIAVERAKQRKEEEEKRYEETRMNAARKLLILEEKMRSKSGGEKDENRTSPGLNVQHGSNTLLPDWEKDKDKSRSRTNSEEKEDKPPKEYVENFRNNQDNRGNFGRDRERERDRDLRPDREREGGGQQFSRQFQINLPPRFQKHAAERPAAYYRQNSGGSPQPPHENRWSVGPAQSHFGGPGGNIKGHRNRNDSDMSERDRDDNKENSRDRERGGNEMAVDRERFNRPPSRDSRERSYEGNWKSSGYHEDSNRRISESEPSHDYDNRQYETFQEPAEKVKDKDKDTRFYDEGREMEKKTSENLKPANLIQEDPFDERENVYDKSREEVQSERREMPKREEHRERPQRPDSRDSRASRDSRNSRDSIREEKIIEINPANESVSWADSTYDVHQKEDKRRKDFRDERDLRRDSHPSHPMPYHPRHIPGPITKEKLEASEKSDSSRSVNLVPLVRNENKKPELKKTDNQWEGGSSGDAWQRLPPTPAPPPPTESWVDMTSSSHPANTEPTSVDAGQGDVSESQKAEANEVKPPAKVPERDEETRDSRPDRPMGRGGNRSMRGGDNRGVRGWGGSSSYFRGTSWRGVDRGRRSQQRRPHMGRSEPWQHSESEDEVSASTESGKEDKRQDQDRKHFPRSPKQGSKKTDKDDRIKDSNRKMDNEKDYGMMNDNRRYEKKGMYDSHMERGFPPRGEPSRRGRGGAPFRSKGSSTNVGRRMDGYGPPTSKKPFSESGQHLDDDKKSDGNSTLSKEEAMSKLSLDEKMKMNQQHLAAGIIGSSRLNSNMPPRLRKKSDSDRRDRRPQDRRGPVKSGSGSGGEVDEAWETTSEVSDREDQSDNRDKSYGHSGPRGRRHSQPNRGGRDKRSGGSYDRESRKPMVNGNLRGPNKSMAPRDQDKQSDDKKQPRPDNKDKRNNMERIDISNTASVVVVDGQPGVTVEEDQRVFDPDNNGFQEVRSKKNVKENRQQKDEPQKGPRERSKPSRPESVGPPPKGWQNDPRGEPRGGPRTNGKLAPRFARLRETTRLQKIAQHQQTHDINDLNKVNQVTVFPVKDLTTPAPPPPVNAWDKPITGSLRTVTPPPVSVAPPPAPQQETSNVEVNEHVQSTTSSQRSSPSGDKTVGKFPREPSEKAVLDGTSPPVQTIIFENTNFKSAPVDVAMKSKYTNQINKNQRTDKSRESRPEEENVGLGFKSPGPDMKLQDKADPIQMPMSFAKNEDSADMKLDFRFDSDLTQLTDDKSSKTIAAMQMTRSIQLAAHSSTAELQFKVASVKKVWENPPAVLEHGGEEHPGSNVSTASSFTPTFGNSVEQMDPTVGEDSSDAVYNAGQQLQNNANSYNGTAVQSMIKADPSTNLLAPQVKPQPQATLLPHTGPLSPPAPPGPHINYQPQAQYSSISTIPSPPTAFTPQPELYPTFQINNAQVMSSQSRSQFSQFGPYLSQGLGQTSGYSPQSMYLQHTASQPPPPSAAPPDIFQTQLSQYRIQPPPYATSQQLNNNPNTVMISTSSASLMSATVKPSPIGSKATYQAPSQPPPSQLYIYPEPHQLQVQSHFLQNSQLVQRPAPALPPSSASYYSANNPITGGGAGGYYQPGSSNMQAAQNLHQTTFSMQGFNTPSPTPTGMNSFGSNFLSNGLQMAQPQQYCSSAPSYIKSAAEHQDVLSVFSSPAAQINSANGRSAPTGGGKPCPPGGPSQQQPSPTQNHKFAAYQQNISPTTQLLCVLQMIHQQQQQQQQRGGVNVRVTPRYPAPIQRPVSYQPSAPVRHLPPPSRARYKPTPASTPPATVATTAAAAHYYTTQNNSTKHENSEMETKKEATSNDCENGATAEVPTGEDSSPANE